MFRKMNRQGRLDEGHLWMPEVCRKRLEETWPQVFRKQVLGMIPEEAFAVLYSPDVATAYSRAREESEAFKREYAIRSGIESTNAEVKTAHGLGKVWTRGATGVSFVATMTGTACNIKRFMRHQCAHWLGNEEKMAPATA